MGYIENFIEAILSNSESREYKTAILEWVDSGDSILLKEPDHDFCSCKHIIHEVYFVTNIHNKRILKIGNCCIKKFGINRQHFNTSKMNYVEFGLIKATSPGVRDYLKFDTYPRIEAGKPFTKKDLQILEQVTGKVSRFKIKKNSDSSEGLFDFW